MCYAGEEGMSCDSCFPGYTPTPEGCMSCP
jgi:hypothetical protein